MAPKAMGIDPVGIDQGDGHTRGGIYQGHTTQGYIIGRDISDGDGFKSRGFIIITAGTCRVPWSCSSSMGNIWHQADNSSIRMSSRCQWSRQGLNGPTGGL